MAIVLYNQLAICIYNYLIFVLVGAVHFYGGVVKYKYTVMRNIEIDLTFTF